MTCWDTDGNSPFRSWFPTANSDGYLHILRRVGCCACYFLLRLLLLPLPLFCPCFPLVPSFFLFFLPLFYAPSFFLPFPCPLRSPYLPLLFPSPWPPWSPFLFSVCFPLLSAALGSAGALLPPGGWRVGFPSLTPCSCARVWLCGHALRHLPGRLAPCSPFPVLDPLTWVICADSRSAPAPPPRAGACSFSSPPFLVFSALLFSFCFLLLFRLLPLPATSGSARAQLS